MSNPVPSQIALTQLQNGTLADASVVQSNDAAIQAAVNALIVALSGGTSGQFLKAVDGSDVVWEKAASLVSTAIQSLAGPLEAPFIGSTSSTCSLATGAITVTTGSARITATDGSTLSAINGHPDSSGWFLVLINGSGSDIIYTTGGGAGVGINTAGILPSSARMYLWFDPISALWEPYEMVTISGPRARDKITLTYGATVTPDAAQGEGVQTVTITNATAFTLASPANPPTAAESQSLYIELFNNSGGNHGTITFGAAYGAPSPLPSGGGAGSIANGKRRMYHYRWSGALWVLMSSSVTLNGDY